MVVEKKNTILVVLIILALFTCFVQSETLFHGITSAKRLYFFFIMATIFLSTSFMLLFRKNTITISINYLDISILLFLTYSFIRLIFTKYVSLYDDQFISLILLTCFYFVVKNVAISSTNKDILITGLLITGFLQGLYGLVQLYGLFPSNNQYFKITGSFGNPDAFASYTVSIIPFALGIYLKNDFTSRYKKAYKNFALLTFVVLTLALAATRIRGGWLAAIIGCGFILYSKYSIGIKKIFKTKLSIAVISISGLAVMGLFVLFLYNLKPDSANGRFLIWKISAGMIEKNPVFGIGYDRYGAEYNNYQADYFEKGKGSNYEKQIAGNVNRAHNEYLEVLFELGIIGLLLLLAMIINIFRKNNYIVNDETNNSFIILTKGSLISVLVFALTSFPLHILPTTINFFFLLAIVSNYQKKNFGFEFSLRLLKIISIIIAIPIIIFIVFTFNQYKLLKTWKQGVIQTFSGDYLSAEKNFRKIYPSMKNNGEFLMNFGGLLSITDKHKEAIQLLEEAKNRISVTNLFILLGNSYQQVNIPKKAELNYLHAINMVPHKFYAKYHLAKFYFKTNMIYKLKPLVENILKKDSKVNSIAIEEIKQEVQQLIK